MAGQFWNKYAAIGYDALRVLMPYEQLQDALWQVAALTANDRLLVAGCGTGNFEWLATQRLPQLQVDAVDYSDGMLARARAKCAGRAVRHHQANLCERLPFSDASFDVAVMCNVLYALPERVAALREMHRLLRPGGRFILCDRYPGSQIGIIGKRHLAMVRALPPPERLQRWMRMLPALPALLGVTVVNMSMRKFEQAGEYYCYPVDEISRLLTELGFSVGTFQSVYADQCWLLPSIRQSDAEETA